MNSHPYLRAFLAGAFVPTLILPLLLCGFIVLRLVLQVPFPFERGTGVSHGAGAVALGLWNMLWLGSHSRTHLPIGVHGALLPVLLLPGGPCSPPRWAFSRSAPRSAPGSMPSTFPTS